AHRVPDDKGFGFETKGPLCTAHRLSHPGLERLGDAGTPPRHASRRVRCQGRKHEPFYRSLAVSRPMRLSSPVTTAVTARSGCAVWYSLRTRVRQRFGVAVMMNSPTMLLKLAGIIIVSIR